MSSSIITLTVITPTAINPIDPTEESLEKKTNQNLQKVIEKINHLASFQILFSTSGLSNNKNSFETVKQLTRSLTEDRKVTPQIIWETFYQSHGSKLDYWSYFKASFAYSLLCETKILDQFISAYSLHLVDNLRDSLGSKDGLLRYSLLEGLLKDFHQLLVDQNEAFSQKEDLKTIFAKKDHETKQLRGKELYQALGASYVDHFTPKEMGSFFLNIINTILRKLLKNWIIPWILEKLLHEKKTPHHLASSTELPEYYHTQILISITSIVREKIEEMAKNISENPKSFSNHSTIEPKDKEDELTESPHDKLLSNITKELLYTHFILDEEVTETRLKTAKTKSSRLVSFIQKEIKEVSNSISQQLENRSLYEELFAQIFEKIDQDLLKETNVQNIAALKNLYNEESKKFRNSVLDLSIKAFEPVLKSALLIDYAKERKNGLQEFNHWYRQQFYKPIEISQSKIEEILKIQEKEISTITKAELTSIEKLLEDIQIQLKGAIAIEEQEILSHLSSLKIGDRIEMEEKIQRDLLYMQNLTSGFDLTINPPMPDLAKIKDDLFIKLKNDIKEFEIVHLLNLTTLEPNTVDLIAIHSFVEKKRNNIDSIISSLKSLETKKEQTIDKLTKVNEGYIQLSHQLSLLIEEKRETERKLSEHLEKQEKKPYFSWEEVKNWFPSTFSIQNITNDSSDLTTDLKTSDEVRIIIGGRSRAESTESIEEPSALSEDPIPEIKEKIAQLIKSSQQITQNLSSEILKGSKATFFKDIKNFEYHLQKTLSKIQEKDYDLSRTDFGPDFDSDLSTWNLLEEIFLSSFKDLKNQLSFNSIKKQTLIKYTKLLHSISSIEDKNILVGNKKTLGFTSTFLLSFVLQSLLSSLKLAAAPLQLIPATLMLTILFGQLHQEISIKNNRTIVNPKLFAKLAIANLFLSLAAFYNPISYIAGPRLRPFSIHFINGISGKLFVSQGQERLLKEGMTIVDQEIRPVVKTIQIMASKPDFINRIAEIGMRQFATQFPKEN